MNKQDRLNKAVNYIIFKGLIKEKKDISLKMDVNNSNVSSALNGNEKYLTDRFLRKFAKTFKIINGIWLITGEGEMLNGEQMNKDRESEEPEATYTTAREEQLLRQIKQLEAQIEFEKRRSVEYVDTDRRLNELQRDYNKLYEIVVLLVGGHIKDARKQLESVEGKSK